MSLPPIPTGSEPDPKSDQAAAAASGQPAPPAPAPPSEPTASAPTPAASWPAAPPPLIAGRAATAGESGPAGFTWIQPQGTPGSGWGTPAPVGSSRTGRGRALARIGLGLIALLLAFGLGIGAGRAGLGSPTQPGPGGTASGAALPTPGQAGLPPDFGLFYEAWGVLKDNYVEPSALESRDLTYGAINGLVEAVGDTDHTRFLTANQLREEQEGLSGSFAGVGAVMAEQDGVPVVQSVFVGSPAERAGLRPGDHVVGIDGESTDGLSLNEVVAKVRGEAGTVVRLSVLREGSTQPTEISITRAVINVSAVSWAFMPGTKIAVIRLEQFQADSTKDVVAALQAALDQSATGIVLDLRNNTGGYVSEAVAIASQFLTGGDVYIAQDGKGERTPVAVQTGGIALRVPLTVLIDHASASSSEIVAGALQDAGRAKLVGVTTFGTGTVLGTFTLSDGSALLVGTVEWLTPAGRQIWKHGITPDVTVELPSDGRVVTPSEFATLGAAGIRDAGDTQLFRAVEVVQGK